VPRFATATVTELSRVGLFQELPGELLTKLAQNMRRQDVGPGDPIVLEGEDGDDFYVILRGLAAVSHPGGLAPRRMLRPGDYFGEVALAMDIPPNRVRDRARPDDARQLRQEDLRRVRPAALRGRFALLRA